MQSSGAGTSKQIPLQESALALPAIPITFPFSIFDISYLLHQFIILISKMTSNISMASDDSDVFYVEQISNEPSPRRNNTPNILNSTEFSEHHTSPMPSVSSIASPQTQIFTIHDDSNEPTMSYGIRRQLPTVPPSLNDLNLPPNPFNILATMAVVDYTEDDNNDGYIPQSPDPSDPSPLSTPPMNVSTFNSLEATHTTTDDNTFYSDDEPRGIYFLPSTPTPPPPPRKPKRKLSLGMSFPKEGGCRSTYAKPAVRRSPQQRTPQVHLAEVRDSNDTSNLYKKLLNL